MILLEFCLLKSCSKYRTLILFYTKTMSVVFSIPSSGSKMGNFYLSILFSFSQSCFPLQCPDSQMNTYSGNFILKTPDICKTNYKSDTILSRRPLQTETMITTLQSHKLQNAGVLGLNIEFYIRTRGRACKGAHATIF